MKRYILHITPIGPIHIGTGDELIPFSYIIKNNNLKDTKKNYFIRIDETALLQRFDQDKIKEFQTLASKDNFVALRQFFTSVADEIIPRNQDCILSMSEVTEEVERLWDELHKRPQNSFSVRPTIASARAGKGLVPYLPGSSLKGSLRTALVHALPQELKYKKMRAQDDPFRALSVSDALFSGKGTRMIGAAYLYNRKKMSIENLQMLYEVIKGQVMCVDNPPDATCTITINSELQNIQRFDFKIPDMPDIARKCNQFYGELLEQEDEDFYKNAPDDVFAGFKVSYDVLAEVEKTENEFFMRLGRHSQFEYITLNDISRYPNYSHSTVSRTLFKYKNMYLPMGWLRVRYEQVS